MTTYERRHTLLELLQKQPGLRVPEQARRLGVSRGTIRNDLNALEAEGLLTRVHGGAVLNKQPPLRNSGFDVRYQERVAAKQAIAQKAAELVLDGDSLLLDASTTAYYLAQQLFSRHRLRVVTNGIDVARLLAKDSTNTVVLLGGIMTPDGSSVTGTLSEQIIRELHVQKAFVSCSGFSLTRGLTDVHLAEAQLKNKALASAHEVFALVDASKLGKEDLTPFATPEQVSHLYTDANISESWINRLKDANIQFTVCVDA